MKFITREELQDNYTKFISFDSVKVGQLFVDTMGCLCLKKFDDIAFRLTDSNGILAPETEVYEPEDRCVLRILHDIIAIKGY